LIVTGDSLIPALVVTLDLIGTFVFAISGAAAGVRHRLDIFGVIVLAIVAATAGGIIRDLLIGAVPPAAMSDWRYFAVSIVAGVATFRWYPGIRQRMSVIMLIDAAGLGLFAVVGAQKALAFAINPFIATLLGMLTGIGGGIVRDLLIREIPVVFRATPLYAVAALSGAAVVVIAHVLDLPPVPSTITGAAVCFGMRLLAIRRNWNLPVAPHID
jgi:uncharacterized membrane protein YeiH